MQANVSLAGHASLSQICMTIVVFVITVLVFRHVSTEPAPSVAPNCTLNRTTSASCPAESECRLSAYDTDLTACIPALATTGTACTDACYASDAESTACEGDGSCVGQPSDCRGFCTTNASCVSSIPFNTEWLTLITDNANVPYVLDYQVTCTLGQCLLFTLDWYWQKFLNQTGVIASAALQCKDFLDDSFVEERDKCIETEAFLLDVNITDPVENNTLTTLPNQFRMCTFRYTCSRFNMTLPFNTKRAMVTSEERAFELLSRVRHRIADYAAQPPTRVLAWAV